MANLDFVLIKEIYYLFSIFAVFLVYWQYFKIRILIDSIAACEIDIKIRESEHFKEQKNFSQSYFSEYIEEFQREYVFWMRYKRISLMEGILFMTVYLLLPIWFEYDKLEIPYTLMWIQLYVTLAVTASIEDRYFLTKYDRMSVGLQPRENWNTKKATVTCEQADIKGKKFIAACSYIGILLLIPHLVDNNSKFVQFHLNQGIQLFGAELCLALGIGVAHMPRIAACILGIVLLGFAIVGIFNVYKEQCKRLPIIGEKDFKL